MRLPHYRLSFSLIVILAVSPAILAAGPAIEPTLALGSWGGFMKTNGEGLKAALGKIAVQ